MPFVFAAALLIHEAGHFLAAKLVGARVLSVKGAPLGILIKYDMLSVSPIKESIVCFAGSLCGILGAVLALLLNLTRYSFGVDFVLTSATLSFINLMPIKGLDGGEIFTCILESFTLPDKAHRISRAVSGSISIIFWIITMRIQLRHGINISMLIMSVYFLFRSFFSD